MSKEVILTGLRSNAEFHLGNYLGAILPMVELQKKHAGEFQVNMFVPDLHSFTTPIDHGTLYEQTIQNLKTFVAAGLDINNDDTFIYRQSYIPAHSELTWILNCFSYFGELSRMTQFKEKGLERVISETKGTTIKETLDWFYSDQNPEKIYTPRERMEELLIEQFHGHKDLSSQTTAGLFTYPVLMAADILLYGAKWIPVGEDQRQHVEFTRDLAIRINNKFGNIFVVPEDNAKQTEFAGHSEPVRVRSLRNPEKKMSKSVEDSAGTIMLSDSPDDAAQKVTSATTDSEGVIHWDWEKQPGITNLLQILSLLSNHGKDEVASEWDGKSSYGELKAAVAEVVRNFLSDFQSKLSQVNQDQLMQKLEADEAAMSTVANQTLERVQQAVGLRPKL
jgi:tryptophanyl-tRNA synthetase